MEAQLVPGGNDKMTCAPSLLMYVNIESTTIKKKLMSTITPISRPKTFEFYNGKFSQMIFVASLASTAATFSSNIVMDS